MAYIAQPKKRYIIRNEGIETDSGGNPLGVKIHHSLIEKELVEMLKTVKGIRQDFYIGDGYVSLFVKPVYDVNEVIKELESKLQPEEIPDAFLYDTQ